MSDDLKANVAVHGSRLDRLEDDMKRLYKVVEAGNSDIREIRDVMMQAKGGWRTLVMVGGISGAVGALIGKLLPFLPLKP